MRYAAAIATAALILAVLGAPATAQDASEGRYQSQGDAGGFWNVMPPGQHGVVNLAELPPAQGGMYPAHFNDQTAMYESLVYEGGLPVDGARGEPFLGVTDGDLLRFYKDASFGIDGTAEDGAIERVYSPGDRDDVVVLRDSAFGVPRVFGDTREGAMFAIGYATAEDRLFLMDLLRHVGRARMSEFLGASEANMAMDRAQLLVAPYTEEELVAQAEEVCAVEPEGPIGCADLDAYAAGVNAFIDDAMNDPSLLPNEYVTLQEFPEDWIRADTVAIASLVGGIFGRGGGGEVASGELLSQLIAQHGEETGRALFDDFHSANDPEAPHTVDEPFPYNNADPAQIDPDSTALVDVGSVVPTFSEPADDGGGLPFDPAAVAEAINPGADGMLGALVDGPLGPIDLRVPANGGMSNAILAGAEVTDGGVPIAVFGPQTGYFTPQLLVEMEIHAPGIDARGAAFAGTNVYVQLGRGRDYAWSATSAGADNVDQWVVELCEPEGGEATATSQGYLHQGECKPMDVYTHSQTSIPSAGGIPTPGSNPIQFDLEIERIPDYDFSPVVARATVEGRPVAIFEQRSTYGQELASARGFQRINDPDYMAGGVDAFLTAFDGVDYTFNWFYIDAEDIAYKHSCLCPIRDPRVDTDLPAWGNGEWDWTGEYLAPEDQPQAVNPESGFFANWNNKQAPLFRSAGYSYSSTYRSEFLAARMRGIIASGQPLTRGAMVSIMEDAGTVDLQGQEIYSLALEIMGEAPPADVGDRAQLLEMRDTIAAWVAAGGHRRDVDRDGIYDHATAVAIGDVWLHPMLSRVFDDELGEATLPERVEDHPRQGVGSAFNGGRANFLHKDFRQVLGQAVEGARSRTFCGDGTRDGCAVVLWQALGDAAAELAMAPPEEAACTYPEAYHFGSAAVEEWVYPADCDNIIQTAAGVVGTPPMRWVNRPTFQQVVQVGSRVGRLDGATRIATAAALSRQAFPGGATTAVVASAVTFADAVAGTPLAAALEGPLLLTNPGALPGETARELLRLGVTDVVVLGGTAAVDDAVITQLQELGMTPRRVSGDDRYATAAAIAAEVAPDGIDRAVVASGEAFPDALAAGPFAVHDDRVILLTRAADLPAATADALVDATDVVIAGGVAAVSDAVASTLEDSGAQVTRRGGDDRYETARMFTEAALDVGAVADDVYAVTGRDFPDALTAGVAATRSGGVLVLVEPAGLHTAPTAGDFITDQADVIRHLWLVGGQAAIPSALRAELEAVL